MLQRPALRNGVGRLLELGLLLAHLVEVAEEVAEEEAQQERPRPHRESFTSDAMHNILPCDTILTNDLVTIGSNHQEYYIKRCLIC